MQIEMINNSLLVLIVLVCFVGINPVCFYAQYPSIHVTVIFPYPDTVVPPYGAGRAGNVGVTTRIIRNIGQITCPVLPACVPACML